MNSEGVNGNIMLLANRYNVVHLLAFHIYFVLTFIINQFLFLKFT